MLLWNSLTGGGGGSREHWYAGTLGALIPARQSARIAMIPAIRRIGAKGSESDGFSGDGLIERLAKLQNPDVLNQASKDKFSRVCAFLKSVTDNETATIEIPYQRDTIVVHMDGKALPLESLGTGIHEVVILAAAATILEGTVVCVEEPELHLNPVLQRKLVRYLMQATSNQYFITTHSAALMDTPDAEVYHIHLDDGQSIVERVTSDRKRSAVCEDLGYHPSDLLQANCIIWVEGPSDRIYILKWIAARAPELQEGVHFSIMFYGGRLASHLSGCDLDEATAPDEFISLRRLNRRAVIVLDSDRSSGTSTLNETKTRLISEFSVEPGHAWVTDGREIENYLPAEHIRAAITALLPTATPTSASGRYHKMLDIKSSADKKVQPPKVEIAKYITTNFDVDESRLDLKEQLDKLIDFIRSSNPSYERITA